MAEPDYDTLTQALRSIDSMLEKCEKAQLRLKAGTSQYTLLKNRINALRIASSLIAREIDDCQKRETI